MRRADNTASAPSETPCVRALAPGHAISPGRSVETQWARCKAPCTLSCTGSTNPRKLPSGAVCQWALGFAFLGFMFLGLAVPDSGVPIKAEMITPSASSSQARARHALAWQARPAEPRRQVPRGTLDNGSAGPGWSLPAHALRVPLGHASRLPPPRRCPGSGQTMSAGFGSASPPGGDS